MNPSVVRSVHYSSSAAGPCVAAIITAVNPDSDLVNLAVFYPDGGFAARALVPRGNNEPGTWHWPEREEGLATGGLIKHPESIYLIGEQ